MKLRNTQTSGSTTTSNGLVSRLRREKTKLLGSPSTSPSNATQVAVASSTKKSVSKEVERQQPHSVSHNNDAAQFKDCLDAFLSEEEEEDNNVDEPHARSSIKQGGSQKARSKRRAVRIRDSGHVSVEGAMGHANEDRLIVRSNEQFHLFVVIDGHGGSNAADFIVDTMFAAFERVYDDGFESRALETAACDLDKEFCTRARRTQDYSGACYLAIIVYMDPETDTEQKIVLNCGDCRAIVKEEPSKKEAKGGRKSSTSQCEESRVIALSDDHCARNRSEKLRALEAGAYIQNNRIAGVLEPFRSLGDIDVKTKSMKNWVIATPEIRKTPLAVGCSTLLLATDGVWGVLTNEVAMEIVQTELEANRGAARAARAVVDKARERGSQDDITAIVVLI
ncbi:TPA: hypothetical protein N0F65_011063 [Lagenidium giganteum]|uniref:PPM-type phosphatase domain-containing protein n=1 Tax=Lagenidium giganteum TaxID=4803 RepID=A0AAV2ZF65_9STRA|nr:TPA: hypothetical protein N0F65_011063 [Lagenidium giganteum]